MKGCPNKHIGCKKSDKHALSNKHVREKIAKLGKYFFRTQNV